jgi:acyl-CoA synthetase (AMP-forming)/AMP-acid ligase II
MGIVEYEREHRTLGFLLRDKARRRGNTPFAFYRDRSITYEALEEQSNRIANALIQRLGVRKGDRIAVMFPNCAEYVVLQFAVSKTGGIQVPVNIEAKGELLAHFLQNSDPASIVLHSQFLPLLQSIRRPASSLSAVDRLQRYRRDAKLDSGG